MTPLHPMWSLPPSIAIPDDPSSSSSSLSSPLTPPPIDVERLSVRFPVAPKGRHFDMATIRTLYTLPDPALKFHKAQVAPPAPDPMAHKVLDYSDRNHAVHVRSIDGLYVPKDLVRHLLRPEPGKQKAVLDLAPTKTHLAGGGGGNWAIDMALEFPHVQVVGIDQQPHPSKRVPPNCRFVQENYNAEMPHHHDKYDIVHARTIGGGVRDYPALVAELGRCLKPGGLILLCDGDLQLLDHNLEPQDMALDDGHNRAPRYSWLARMFFETYNVLKAHGVPVDAGLMLGSWLRKSGAFENVESTAVHTPIGPWKTSANPQEHEKLKYMGTLCRLNVLDMTDGLAKMLVNDGNDPSDPCPRYNPLQVDNWMVLIDQELRTMRVRLHIKYHYAWAVKRRPGSPPSCSPLTTFLPPTTLSRPRTRSPPHRRPLRRSSLPSQPTADGAIPPEEEADDELSDEDDSSSAVSEVSSVGSKRKMRQSHSPHRSAPAPVPIELREKMEELMRR